MFKNTAKTTILLAAMGGLIVGIASLLGGGSSGSVMIGLFLAFAMVGWSYWSSDKLAFAPPKHRSSQKLTTQSSTAWCAISPSVQGCR
jgi:hypothetical protein